MYLLNFLHRHESPSYQKNAGLSRTVKEHLYNLTLSTKNLLIQVNMTGVADYTSNKELKRRFLIGEKITNGIMRNLLLRML